jgi:hypothetical protein
MNYLMGIYNMTIAEDAPKCPWHIFMVETENESSATPLPFVVQ